MWWCGVHHLLEEVAGHGAIYQGEDEITVIGAQSKNADVGQVNTNGSQIEIRSRGPGWCDAAWLLLGSEVHVTNQLPGATWLEQYKQQNKEALHHLGLGSGGLHPRCKPGWLGKRTNRPLVPRAHTSAVAHSRAADATQLASSRRGQAHSLVIAGHGQGRRRGVGCSARREREGGTIISLSITNH
jgi:hypothetical protein